MSRRRITPIQRCVLFAGKFIRSVQNRSLAVEVQMMRGRMGNCGEGTRVLAPIRLTGPENLHLGHNVHIQPNANIRAEGGVWIGDNTHISRNVVIYSMNHRFRDAICLPYDEEEDRRAVKIGRNVWIGINVCITPGAEIGDGAIIGMGTVVSGRVPPLAIVAGGKWRHLADRDRDHYEQLDRAGHYGGMNGQPLRADPRPLSAPERIER